MAERHSDVPEADAREQERPWAPHDHFDDNPRVSLDEEGSADANPSGSDESEENE